MTAQPDKIPVGASACLLGEEVRFDGGHKHHRFLTGILGEYVEWVTVCPELEAGLGIPRESFRLVRDGERVARFVGNRSGRDATGDVLSASTRIMETVAPRRLRGFVLKKGSPSCGLASVRVYDGDNPAVRNGRGIFADRLTARYPNLPVEEEGRLQDARIRENFICRIFTYDRWLRLREAGCRIGDLVRFHTEHKMMIMAHSPMIANRLGRLVARAKSLDLDKGLDAYEGDLMLALSKVASRGRHSNVLQHLTGFLKRELNAADRAELVDVIHEYRVGRVPLAVPLVLLGHHFKHHRDDWIECQTYLRPYPPDLALRSTI